MSASMNAQAVLDREFLTIRGKLLEVAAALDRIERAEGAVAGDPRLEKIHQSLEAIAGGQPNRAEQVQQVFSLPYDPQWQSKHAQEKR